MCLPWNHKWETAGDTVTRPSYGFLGRTYIEYGFPVRCAYCSKEKTKKYRI